MFGLSSTYNNIISPVSIYPQINCETRDESWNQLEIKLGLRQSCPTFINTYPVKINTTHRNYFNNTPYYTVDIFSNVKNNYTELNDDKSVIKTVTKYYYYKTLEKYLISEMIDLLGYLYIVGDTTHLIKNIKDYSDKLPTEKETRLKLTYDTVWYKVQNNEQEFKKFLHHELKNIFEENIKS